MIADDLAAFLVRREPIFHNPEVIWDEASFDAEIASDFREIGASGSCYERQAIKDVVLGRLAGTHEDSLADDFRMHDVEVIQLRHRLLASSFPPRNSGSRLSPRQVFTNRRTNPHNHRIACGLWHGDGYLGLAV